MRRLRSPLWLAIATNEQTATALRRVCCVATAKVGRLHWTLWTMHEPQIQLHSVAGRSSLICITWWWFISTQTKSSISHVPWAECRRRAFNVFRRQSVHVHCRWIFKLALMRRHTPVNRWAGHVASWRLHILLISPTPFPPSLYNQYFSSANMRRWLKSTAL